MAPMPKVMIVEDEEPLTLLLRYNLESEGFAVETCDRGDEAEVRLMEAQPDLLLLDWMLPGLSGIELCRRLRARDETSRLPIIMLTARGEEAERIRGLATGADDYVVKPFSVAELMARVRAMLRRAKPEVVSTVLKGGDIEVDRETHRVRRARREVHLGPTEFRAVLSNPAVLVRRHRVPQQRTLRGAVMKYLLLINAASADATDACTPEDWTSYDKEVTEAGILVSSEALADLVTATSVQVGDDGRRAITTDGPFAETREVLGGFYVIDVPDLDAALDWAARCPGARGGGSVVVRPVADFGA